MVWPMHDKYVMSVLTLGIVTPGILIPVELFIVGGPMLSLGPSGFGLQAKIWSRTQPERPTAPQNNGAVQANKKRLCREVPSQKAARQWFNKHACLPQLCW